MSGPKEAAYDEHISPLIGQVIGLCKEHGINAAMTFALDHRGEESDTEEGVDEPLYCTTVLPVDESDAKGYARVVACRKVMIPPSPPFIAMTIRTAK